MKITKNYLKQIILEEINLHLDNKLHENFYFLDDKEKTNPLAKKILSVVLSKLPNATLTNLKEVEASGAEGIVYSIDDYRVIKMFFSLENAVKVMPLLNRNAPFTANIYTAGKINLDKEVMYFRSSSSYSQGEARPTKTIYYIVMERVTPDEETYNSTELAYDRYARLSKLQYKDIQELSSLGDPGLTQRAKQIMSAFLKDKGLMTDDRDPNEVINSLDKKTRNILLLNEYSAWAKSKTKDFFFIDDQNKPLLLKNFLLNLIGFFRNVNFDVQKLRQFLLSKKEFNVGSRTGKKVSENFVEIENLLKEIIITGKIPWRDIHRGQFGRNKKGKLIALDLGIKGNSDRLAPFFDKNVSTVSLRSSAGLRLVREDKNKKILNFWDFDGTLLRTPGPEEGKAKYEEIYKKKYPHVGWISKKESLDPALKIEQIKPVTSKFNSFKDAYNIILSDRRKELTPEVKSLLELNNIFPNLFLLHNGLKKVERVKRFFEQNHDFDEINFFDDNSEAIRSFIEFRDLYSTWRPELTINVYNTSSGAPTLV